MSQIASHADCLKGRDTFMVLHGLFMRDMRATQSLSLVRLGTAASRLRSASALTAETVAPTEVWL